MVEAPPPPPAAPVAAPPKPGVPLPPASLHGTRRQKVQTAIKAFFGGNAVMAVVILVLICVFLLKEGAGFFPLHYKELQRYRLNGLEFVDHVRLNTTEHSKLASLLNRAFYSQVNEKVGKILAQRGEALQLVNAGKDAASVAWLSLVAAWAVEPPAPEVVSAKKSEWQLALKNWAKKLLPSKSLSVADRDAIVAEMAELSDEYAVPPTLARLQQEVTDQETAAKKELEIYQTTAERFEEAIEPINEVLSEMTEIATANQTATNEADSAQDKKTQLEQSIPETTDPVLRKQLEEELATVSVVAINYPERVQPLLDKKPLYTEKQAAVVTELRAVGAEVPKTGQNEESNRLLGAFHRAFPVYVKELEETPARLAAWDLNAPVPAYKAVTEFLFGKEWITGGSWQHYYGVMPLFVGSLMISFVALLIAIPFGVGSAIFVNQFATPAERTTIKPLIEFIQAIPSVVLGFLGISILGESLREMSQIAWLQWIPGFPFAERLNILTAGVLLGFMAIPTIFTLAEDSINNVPQAYLEAAEAMGSTKLQTVFRVIVPTALSGIIAAVLLGLGRVIGETMVVLLVAGNRIQIPDFFTEGLGAFFQPAHTLTGIIAQELGEVPAGSLHYRALFIVGVLLFFIALAINGTAQYVLKKFRSTPA